MDENVLESLEGLDSLDTGEEAKEEEVAETDETLDDEDGIVDEEVTESDDGLLGELNADIPDVTGSVTLNCTSCSALYLQLIGDPEDAQDAMFAKSITEMTATCPQCGELTRQVVVSAPLSAPDPIESEEPEGEGKTKLLSSLNKLGVRQYGKSPKVQSSQPIKSSQTPTGEDPQINSSMMTKRTKRSARIQSNAQEDVTQVMFRKCKDNGEIVAVFVDDVRGDMVGTYLHNGQHGDASVSWVDEDTVLARPTEYKELMIELGQQGYFVDSVASWEGRKPRSSRIASNAQGGVGSFRRFESGDWNGYAGAENLPDGSEPLIYNGTNFDIVIGGNEDGSEGVDVQVTGYFDATEEEFIYDKQFNNVDRAVNYATRTLIPMADMEVFDVDDLQNFEENGMERLV